MSRTSLATRFASASLLATALLATALLATTLLATAPPAPAAPAPQGIKVFGEGATVLKTFRSLGCRASRGEFVALGRSEGWSLFIQIPSYRLATRSYTLRRGDDDGPSFSVGPMGDDAARFANIYNPVPSFPPVGGAISFPAGTARPTQISLGFNQAWSGPSPTSPAANLAGHARCIYPAPRRRLARALR